MSREAAGFPCPDCGSTGPHHIHWLFLVEGAPESMRLSCHRCEAVWTEDLTN